MKNIALIKSIVATSISSVEACWAHWAHSSSHSGSSWRDSRERACHPHWHCRTHGSSCRPGWTDLQQQQLYQPLVQRWAHRKSARGNGSLLCQLHSNRNSLVQDRGRCRSWKERQLQPWRLCHRAREKAYEDSMSVTFDIREWNTGKVVWKR